MNAARTRISLSLVTALVLWCLLAFGLFTSPPKNILSWDTLGYHLYLPATFIHHDPGIHDAAWVHEAMTTYQSGGTLYQISPLPDGRWVTKYPMGLALLWSPFFFSGAMGISGARNHESGSRAHDGIWESGPEPCDIDASSLPPLP